MKLPGDGELGLGTNTRSQQKSLFERLRGVVAQLPGGSPEAAYVIGSTGHIKPLVTPFSVDTFGGAAADDLTHIDVEEGLSSFGYPSGSVILLRGVSASRVVTVAHLAGGTGQISLANASNFPLNDKKWLVLQLRGTTWFEVMRAFGGDAAAARTHLGLTKGATAPNPANPGDDGKALVASGGNLVWGTPLSSGGPTHRLLVSRTTDLTLGVANGSTYNQATFNETTLESSPGNLWDPTSHEIKIPAGITFVRLAANLELDFTSAITGNWWARFYSFFKLSGGGYPSGPDGHSKAGLLSGAVAAHASAIANGPIQGRSGEIAVASNDRLKLMVQASASAGSARVRGASLPAYCWLSAEFYV